MLTFTTAAQKRVSELIGQSKAPVKGLRISARALSPFKIDYEMEFIAAGQEKPGDSVLHLDGFKAYLDSQSAPILEDATVDFVDGLTGAGFKIEGPSKLPPNLSGPVVEKIQEVIEQEVNPVVASHGGRVSLVDIKEDVVYVEFGGGCQGCGMADVTLKHGIKAMIKKAVPEIVEVYDVTDHANGENPYYRSST